MSHPALLLPVVVLLLCWVVLVVVTFLSPCWSVRGDVVDAFGSVFFVDERQQGTSLYLVRSPPVPQR